MTVKLFTTKDISSDTLIATNRGTFNGKTVAADDDNGMVVVTVRPDATLKSATSTVAKLAVLRDVAKEKYMIAQGTTSRPLSTVSPSMGGGDPTALVEAVLRESYLEQTMELRAYADKVKFYNAAKKMGREQLVRARERMAGLKEGATISPPYVAPAYPPSQYPGPGWENGMNQIAESTGATVPKPAQAAAPAPAAPTRPALFESAQQRAAVSPEMHAKIAKFLSYPQGSLEYPLEQDPQLKAEFLAAIPYMTRDELAKALLAFGGEDMHIKPEHDGIWNEILAAMTPAQVVSLMTLPSNEMLQMVSNGDWGTRYRGRLAEVTAGLEAKTGKSYHSSATSYDGYGAMVEDLKNEPMGPVAGAAPTPAAAPAAPPPGSNGAGEYGTYEALKKYTDNLETHLQQLGDDAQLANVDLQNCLQKCQQTMQMMSNISKLAHDTACNTIRKIGG